MVLQIASQNGIVAMLIFIGLLLYFWLRLALMCWHKWSGLELAGLAAMTAVIFDAMFNHVFYNPASMFVFALLAGMWWAKLPQTNQTNLQVPNQLISITTLFIIVGLSVWPVRWVVSEWHVGQAMAYASQPKLEAQYYEQAYAWDKENFRAVFGMGQSAYKQKKYALSAQYFEAFEKFYPYNPPALNMLGAAYLTSGQFAKAEAAFQRAIDVYPGFTMAEQNLHRAQLILKQRVQQPTAKDMVK
jgi:tetratricopeptide (TPR) repeat protein